MSTPEEAANTAIYQRMLDASNTHDEDLIAETIDEIFEPDVDMGTPLPIEATGAEAVKQVNLMLHRAFPDLLITSEDLIAKDDKVVSRQTVRGTHTGDDYMGVPAAGASVTYDEIFILRFVEGRIAETRGVVNVLALLKQLGSGES
ncbi:ester cyclase [Nocardioidaceae bacterium SCSIO 66511]|nr:ester cyclase [Nocardioidaceae bacterium SCSIO 66511]